jgi:hypothetical protein
MINCLNPMGLDLYGLSMSPPLPPPPPSSPPSSNDHCTTNRNSSDLISLSIPIDSISSSLSKQQSPPIIYPWMRKVHINNPGIISFQFPVDDFFFVFD